MEFTSGLIDFSNDVSHSGFVAQETGYVDCLGRIVFREGPDATANVFTPFAGEEAQASVSWSFKLSV